MYDIVLVVADDPSSVFVVVFVVVFVPVSPSTEAPFVTIALAATSGQSSTYVVFVLSPVPSPSRSALEETPLTVVLLVGNCSETPPSALETTRIVTVTTLSPSPSLFVLVVAMEEEVEEEEEEEAKEVDAVAGGGVAVELA